jgi:hypothetical protein
MPLIAEHRIERLHLRLPHGQAQRARDVHQALIQATWPELGTEAIVIIRRLYVCSRWDELKQTVADGLRSAMNSSERQTFTNGIELLAHLSRDLADGSAARHWYWQQWHDLTTQPPEIALAMLWQRHGELLPAIISTLKQLGALHMVWRALTPNAATLVVEALKAQYHLEHDDPRGDRESTPVSFADSDETIFSRHQLHHGLSSAIADWRPILVGWSSNDPRVLLAALLIGIEQAPLTILSPDARSWFTVMASALTAPTSNIAPFTNARPPHFTNPSEASTVTAPIINRVQRKNAADETTSNQRPSPSTATSSPTSTDNIATTSPSILIDETPLTETTAFAGVVFLINALAQPALRAVIDDAHWFADVPHGWHVLVNLAHYLGMPTDDPLAVQLEHLLIESGTNHLTTEEQRQAIGAALMIPALALYGADLWDPSLLRAGGRFRLNASHLDVWLPLDSARLPIRLAGLDLNPGWTPWLGRVVTIHYVAGLQIATSSANDALPESIP